MIQKPLISAVMLTADRPHLIQTAINAFLAQTWVNKELIIYDSGKIPAVVAKVPGVVHIFRGPAANIGTLRNRANSRARGKMIAHWDDDDWSAPERMEEQFDLIATHDADIVGYRTLYFRQDHGPSKSPTFWLYDGEADDPTETTMFYKRVTWENRGFPDIMISERYVFMDRRKVITAAGHKPIRMIARHHLLSTCKQGRFIPKSDSWKSVPRAVALSCGALLKSAQ